MKNLLIILTFFILSTSIGPTTSATIQCNYNVGGTYSILSAIYRCEVKNNPNIISEASAMSIDITGIHSTAKNNNDIIGFDIRDKTMQYFPNGLDTTFPNLKLIFILDCQLKEIHQSNLKSFPNLVYFYLHGNHIEVIEEGLFDFNPKLELVGFYNESRIIHIDGNVFDDLPLLSYLYSYLVPCIHDSVLNSKPKVKEFIGKIKSKCQSEDVKSLEKQIETLETDHNSQSYDINLRKIKSSKFIKYRPFSYKINYLTQQKCQLATIKSLDLKIIKIDNQLDDIDTKISRHFSDMIDSHSDLKESINDIAAFRLFSMMSNINQETPVKELINQVIEMLSGHENSTKLFIGNASDQFNFVKEQMRLQYSTIMKLFHTELDVKSLLDDLDSKLDFNLTEIMSSINLHANSSELNQNMIKEQIKALLLSTTIQINQVDRKIDNIEGTSMQLTFSLDSIISSVGGLKMSIKSINETIENVKDMQVSQNDTITTINKHVSNITSNLSDIKADIDTAHQHINTSLTDISNSIAEHQRDTNINQNELKGILTSIEAEIGGVGSVIGTEFAAVSTQLTALQASVGGIALEVGTAVAGLVFIKLSQSGIRSAIDDHRSDFSNALDVINENFIQLSISIDEHKKESNNSLEAIKDAVKKIEDIEGMQEQLKADFKEHKKFMETSIDKIFKMLKDIQESIG